MITGHLYKKRVQISFTDYRLLLSETLRFMSYIFPCYQEKIFKNTALHTESTSDLLQSAYALLSTVLTPLQQHTKCLCGMK